MQALCLMLLGTYYAENYAGIIDTNLYGTVFISRFTPSTLISRQSASTLKLGVSYR